MRALLSTLAVALAVVGCGGGASEDEVEALLDRAFSQSIDSADLSIDAQLELDGIAGFDRPIRVEASGPFVGAEEGLPQFDVDLRVGGEEAGQTVELGFLSTGDRAFAKFGGEFYEQPREAVAEANRSLRERGGDGSGSLSELGLDPRGWVVDAEQQDDEDVAGVPTEHVSGRLDVPSLLADLNTLVERSSEAVGGIAPGTPQPLSEDDIDKLAEAVENPSFDVYVGSDDDRIRRVSASLRFTVPEADRAGVGGIEGGSLRFTIELADVNGDQRIEAPADSRPIADLAEQLGGLGALGGGAGEAVPDDPGGTGSTPEGGEALPGEPSGPPDVDALEEYAECVDAAGPDDAEALARCADRLP